jgi:hypothetical protein
VKKKKPVSPAAPPTSKSTFEWWDATIPQSVRDTFSDKFFAMHRRELHERACMLRRLGYGQAEVRRRLEGYEEWQYEPFATSRLHAEVAKIVAEVYAPSSPRTTSLTPGK